MLSFVPVQDDQPAEHVGKLVERRRRELGWTQEQLAVRVGTTRATVDAIEKGRTRRSYRLPEVLRTLGIADKGEEARVRDTLIRGGIDRDVAADAARIVVAQRLTDPPPRDPPRAGGDAAASA
jgi:transcriptional regulator with XRE-family HTH domain